MDWLFGAPSSDCNYSLDDLLICVPFLINNPSFWFLFQAWYVIGDSLLVTWLESYMTSSHDWVMQ